MGYSKPSVSRAIGILRKAEYITVDKNGHLFLTDEGRAIAERIYERHTIFTQFLTLIGVSPEVASEDACKIEHTISDESFAAIKRFIDEKSHS
jgi:Mn-dependent DtxR family transcriptional regulator